MKVAIEATKDINYPGYWKINGYFIPNEQCELIEDKPMNDIKLTEENAKKIIGNIILEYEFFRDESFKKRGSVNCDDFKREMIEKWKSENWIVKDELESAIDNLKEYYETYKTESFSDQYTKIDKRTLKDLFDYSINAIELLQNKIKELENGKN